MAVTTIKYISQNIQNMFALVDEALSEMQKNLSDEYSEIDSLKALEIEDKINNYRNLLRKEHVQNVKDSKYKYKSGVIYNELFSTADRHYVVLYVSANYASGEVRVLEPKKCQCWQWFHYAELPDPLFEPIINLLKQTPVLNVLQVDRDIPEDVHK